MKNWKIVPLQRQLGEYSSAWDALNSELYNNHPFLCATFVNGLLSSFGNGKQYLCIALNQAAPTAMCIVEKKSPLRFTGFLPAQTQVGLVLAKDVQELNDLLVHLPGLPYKLDLFCLDPILHSNLIETANRTTHAKTININISREFSDYWQARSSNLKKNLRRHENKILENALTERFEVIDNPFDMTAAVNRYAELETRGWKGQQGTALGSNHQQAFYSELMCKLSVQGNAFIHEFWLADQLAASRLVIQGGAMLVILKTTYDESLAQYAPGWLHLKNLVEFAFKYFPGHTLEFYTNASREQMAWADQNREIYNLTLFRNDLLSGLYKVRKHDVFRNPDKTGPAQQSN